MDGNSYFFTNLVLDWLRDYKNYLLFALSLYLGGAGAWFISKASMRSLLMDVPEERSSHSVPIPRGGGLGIFMMVVLAGLVLDIPTHFIFPVIFVAIITFYGDFFELSVRWRLIMQFAAAIMMIFPSLPHLLPSYLAVSKYSYVLIFCGMSLFLVGTANFYNFMDGINGIAGISGVIAFGFLGYFGVSIQQTSAYTETYAILSFCVALACLGFLPFNMPRARVFMGDVGSILLGLVFAGLVIKLSRNLLDFICLTSFLFPCYADELTTMWVRLRKGEKLSKPHRRHLYQLLVNEYGRPHWEISLIYGIVQFLIALTIIFARQGGIQFVLLLLTFYSVSFAFISFCFRRKLNA